MSRLSPTLMQVGTIQVDTKLRELRAPGRLNQVTTLEFIANTPGGLKAYESAMTVDASAATFNAALLLMGLDPNRSRVPVKHFDPLPPAGDPVVVSVEVRSPSGLRRFPAEELVWNSVKKTTLPVGPWVYTGSKFSEGHFLAEADGVLVGFVHSPAPLIEHPGPLSANYGDLVLNPNLGLAPGSLMTLVIKALDRAPSR